MESITVKNFRCFGEEQTARLAPLTLLVGENSTGKTSFQALIRALWDVAYAEIVPNFRERPYDLGSFREIASFPSAQNTDPSSFVAGFSLVSINENGTRDPKGKDKGFEFTATFRNFAGAPYPTERRSQYGDAWIECARYGRDPEGIVKHGFGSESSSFKVGDQSKIFEGRLYPFYLAIHGIERSSASTFQNHGDMNSLAYFLGLIGGEGNYFDGGVSRPFASSPIRSIPLRTYDPVMLSRDPEGEYVPTFLARTAMSDGTVWEELRTEIVEFGRKSGLFDDLRIEQLGKVPGRPFQIQVRKRNRRTKGPYRNIVDMGYGLSQVLPILTELLRPDGPDMFLLQQPEVHLHPSAQAALGSLFCSMAAAGKQIIVETHSEYIVDRIRMDVRDGSSDLNPDDVSVLYFERSEQSIKIHSLSFGDDGEIINAPPGYGQFFMDEVNRSIGI